MTTRLSKEEIEKLLRRKLETLSIYEPLHLIRAYQSPNEGVFVSYRTHPSEMAFDSTHVQLLVARSIGDIFKLNIEPAKRLQGNGRQLVEQLESFCKELGCTKMQVTPSGQGIYFWPKVGYTEVCDVGLQKAI